MTNLISSRRQAAALTILIATLSLAPVACKSRKPVSVESTEEEAPPLMSIVNVADPRGTAQLLTGFYGLEQNSWRWTAQKFSVILRPPRTGAASGATLTFKLNIPQSVMDKQKALSLSASVGGTALSPESYTQAGTFTYTRDVPASVLAGDTVKVDFALDKAMPAAPPDARQLGVIASSVGLEGK